MYCSVLHRKLLTFSFSLTNDLEPKTVPELVDLLNLLDVILLLIYCLTTSYSYQGRRRL